MATKNGTALAMALSRYGVTPWRVEDTCSLIARHAKTLRRLTEMECGDGIHSGEWVNAHADWIEKRYAQVSKRLAGLVAELPATDHGPIAAQIGGDPRGWVVRLIVPTDKGPREVGVE
jgi:hypothetical protein